MQVVQSFHKGEAMGLGVSCRTLDVKAGLRHSGDRFFGRWGYGRSQPTAFQNRHAEERRAGCEAREAGDRG